MVCVEAFTYCALPVQWNEVKVQQEVAPKDGIGPFEAQQTRRRGSAVMRRVDFTPDMVHMIRKARLRKP